MSNPTLFPMLNLAAAAGVSLWQARQFLLAGASKDWHQTTGRVLKAYVDESTTYDEDGSEVTHSAKVHYRYRIGSRQFESTRLTYRPTKGLAVSGAIELLHGIARGRDVDVFYDPRRPDRAVLIPGRSTGNTAYLVLSCTWLVVALWHLAQ